DGHVTGVQTCALPILARQVRPRNAAEFTKRGWPFFVAERFDLFYPGYGDSWPSLHGAIGMTYEVAGGGRAGSAVLRDDQTTYTRSEERRVGKGGRARG